MTRIFRFLIEHALLALIGAAVALLWANSAPDSYFTFAISSAFWVNDVLMALFFAGAVQEVIEELIPGGALHPWRRAVLPVIAGVGGSLGAVVAYETFVFSTDEHLLAPGWPIVAVVDIAFAYFLVKSIFRRSGATAFILLLAIASNAIGLVAVGLRTPPFETQLYGLPLIVAALIVCVVLRQMKVRSFWPYLLIGGALSWWGFAVTGIHPALALLPIVPFFPHAPRADLELFTDAPHSPHESPWHFEHVFRIPVEIILLLFALVNAGILTNAWGTGSKVVLVAALIGRPLGTLLLTAAAAIVGFRLPRNFDWKILIVLACASSVGFVFSLFAAQAVFAIGPVLAEVKLGALLTLGGAGVTIGLAWLFGVGRFARRSEVSELQPGKSF